MSDANHIPGEDSPEFKEQVLLFLKAQNEKAAAALKGKPKRIPAYYTAEYAEVAKRIIDKIVSTQTTQVTKLHGTSPITAKIQWYRGRAYLRDKQDPSGTYANLMKKIGCHVAPDQLTFYIRNSVLKTDLVDLEPVSAAPWKDDFLIWLDTPGKPLHSKFPTPPHVVLSAEDIQWGEARMVGLETLYLFRFAETEVTVIRYDSPAEQTKQQNEPSR